MRIIICIAAVLALLQASQPQTPDAAALVKAGQALLDKGDVDGAVQQFRSAVTADPQRYDAHESLGRALDLQGNYSEAREHLERAIALAPEQPWQSGQQNPRNDALAHMAISFAFESRADDAARFYQREFDSQMQANDPTSAAATANALGRVYLEAKMLDKAEQWYRTGYETSKRLSNRSASDLTLWDMRWEHAVGRIAARKGKRMQALQHAAAVKRLLDKGGNEPQRPAYPYLMGYIDFYTRHYREALASLLKADQKDPFVLGLTAQTYEKLHDSAHARECYQKVMTSTAHSLNVAFTRPRARVYLAGARR
jgi:tetratricopeptide (TPR) repeat protein